MVNPQEIGSFGSYGVILGFGFGALHVSFESEPGGGPEPSGLVQHSHGLGHVGIRSGWNP